MGGAVGADIEIRVWLLLLANWWEVLVQLCFVLKAIFFYEYNFWVIIFLSFFSF